MFDFDEPVGFTIFCDDIREEASGKTSLIGVYEAAMVLHTPFPAVLPKFGFHITICEPSRLTVERDFPIKIEIFLPGDMDTEPSYSFSLPGDPEAAKTALANLPWRPIGDQPPVARLVLKPIVSSMVLKEPGIIRVRAIYKGDRLRCGALPVIPAEALTPASVDEISSPPA